jgi:hypothetical protein
MHPSDDGNVTQLAAPVKRKKKNDQSKNCIFEEANQQLIGE